MSPLHTLIRASSLLGLALQAACAAAPLPALPTASPQPPTATGPAVPPPGPTTTAPGLLAAGVEFSGTISIALASGPGEMVYAALGQDHHLLVARSTDGGRTFEDPVLATGDRRVHVLNVERPAIAVGPDGKVAIAWLELPADMNGGEVWFASSDDEGRTFTPGQRVAVEDQGETTMVAVALDARGTPYLSWLNGSRLRFARADGPGTTFAPAVNLGAGACECCQPSLAMLDEHIHIAYRSLEPGNETGDIRDLSVVRSEDGGRTFTPPVRVSDAHWYLPACPIAGPALTVQAGVMYVAWMDGRLGPPGTLNREDLWLASSQDGGGSFSPNVRINAEDSLHHTRPALGIGPDGRLHVVWEAQAATGDFLYYTRSEDGGRTFAAPEAIASGAETSRGRPRMATVTVSGASLVVIAWVDRVGARLITRAAAK